MSRTRYLLSLGCTVLAACSSSMPYPAAGGASQSATGANADTAFVYVASGDGKISRFAVNELTGALSARTAFDGGRVPTFLAVAPNRKFLFAVNEAEPGELSSFAIQPGTGSLTFLNRTSSGGDGPAHLSVDNTGRWLLAANYGGGNAAVIPIRNDGTLGAATDVVASGKKSHFITVSPDNRFVFVVCLEPNYIAQYRFDDATGKLTPNSAPTLVIPGTNPGPRHLAFHPNGELAFVLNELNSTLSALRYDRANGTLSMIQTVSTLQSDVPGNTGAEVQVHPSGKYVYTSNRGQNSIATFSVDQGSGHLALIGTTSTGGVKPRHFSLNESGTLLLVANQESGNVIAMRVNAQGIPEAGVEVAKQFGSPQYVKVVRIPRH